MEENANMHYKNIQCRILSNNFNYIFIALAILLIHDPLVKMSRDRMVTVEEIVKIIQVVPYYPTGSILEPPVDKIKLVDTNTQWKNNFLRPISSSSILVPFLLPQNMLVKMLYHI